MSVYIPNMKPASAASVAELERCFGRKLPVKAMKSPAHDSDYEQLVAGLVRKTAEEFRNAGGNIDEQRRACCRFLKRGRFAGISQSELIDFLGVSTPSVLDKTGYSDKDAQRVMDILATISDDEIEGVEI